MPGPSSKRSHPSVVAVGASGAGGLLDMAHLLSLLPVSFPGVILLTLHRPADRPSNLASILQRVSALPVMVASRLQSLHPGTCYVGEPAAHLTLYSSTAIELVADLGHGYRNRTIDLLFGSVAIYAANRAIGVVLSGSLADGSRGLAAITQAGGVSMARDPRQHFEGDMPRNAIAAAGPLHCVDYVPGLAREIVTQVVGTGADVLPAGQRMVSLHRLQSSYAKAHRPLNCYNA